MTDPDWVLPDPHSQPEFYADVPLKRLIAWLIDTVLTLLITAVLVPLSGFTALFFLPFLAAAVNFAYRVVSLANGSATPGMWLMAIEFRTNTGARFALPDALLHTLGLTLSFAVAPLQLVSVILMLTTERGQGLSDLAMGSVAINRRAGG